MPGVDGLAYGAKKTCCDHWLNGKDHSAAYYLKAGIARWLRKVEHEKRDVYEDCYDKVEEALRDENSG